jgi:uncharacterized protein YlzI (FlbEa/FlbD family)
MVMKKLLLALIALSCAGNISAMGRLPQVDDVRNLLRNRPDGKITLMELTQIAQLLNHQIENLADTKLELANSEKDVEILRTKITEIDEKIREMQKQLDWLMLMLKSGVEQAKAAQESPE